jgi:HlyD family secretion protein
MGMDRKLDKKWWNRKRILQLSGIGFLALLIFYWLFIGDSSSRLNVQADKITVSEVLRDTFQVYIPVNGSVLPIQTVYLDAIEGGRVESVIREAGSMVNRGDTILILANTNLLLGIMNREAQLFEQRNNLRNTRLSMEQNSLNLRAQLLDLDYQISTAKRKFERSKELFEKELISKEEYENKHDTYQYLITLRELTVETQKQDSIFRNLQIEMLEASVDRIQNNLEFIRKNLDNLTLLAPVRGMLTSLNAEVGESKMQGQRLGQIDILDGYKVSAEIDEYYITRLEVGSAGKFNLAGESYRLVVTKIYPEVQNGRFGVDMEFEGSPPGDLRRGQTLHIRLSLGDVTECLQLARGAFYQSTGGSWAYVLDKSGELAVRRDISLGRMNPDMFEVLEGLKEGDRVITSSYDGFGDVDELVLGE